MAARRARRLSLLLAVLTAGGLIASCTDSVSPAPSIEGRFGIAPLFQSQFAGIIPLSSIQFVIRRSTDTLPARDTTIQLAVGQDSVELVVTVAMFSSSETFTLEVALRDTSGVVVFRGGPVPVTPTSGTAPPPLVSIPITYVGVGSQAASVRILGPEPVPLLAGDSVTLVAEALDSAGVPIPNTPIAWESLDTARVVVPNPANGLIRARGTRGTGLVVARLLTNQADTVTASIQPAPSAIAVQGGNAQTAIVDSLLAQELVARVTATDGLGVAGVWVRFAATAGGGLVTPDSALTDASGDARATWRLGGAAGAQTTRATVAVAPSLTTDFTATAIAGDPAAIAIAAGDGQTAVAGVAVAVSPAVTVTDAHGNLVPAASVTFEIVQGGGILTGAAATTNASGIATVGSWSLGAIVGPNSLRAFVIGTAPQTVSVTHQGSLPTDTTRLRDEATPLNAPQAAEMDTLAVTFTATAIPGAATTLTILAGNAQTDTAAAVLGDSLVVRATDALGNTVPGAVVTWAVALGGGSTSAASTAADANGRAAIQWTQGTLAGTAHAVTAALAAVDTVTFTATVTPATPTQLAFTTDPVTANAGEALNATVAIHDQYGNVATGATDGVTMAIVGGTGTSGALLSGTMSQAAVAGVATFTGLSIDSAGTNYALQATATGLAAATSATFNITIGAAASVLVAPALDSLHALTATAPFTAVARDAGGNVIVGAVFTWEVTDSSIVSIDVAGVVTAIANGTVSVIATTGIAADTATLVVDQRVATVVIAPSDTTLTFAGATAPFTATLTDSLGQMVATAVLWETTDSSVATIDGTGLVTAGLAGTISVIATAHGVADTATLTVGQTVASVVITPDSTDLASLTDTVRLAATAFDLSATVVPGATITWTSLSPALASVDANGLVTALANGVALVEAASDTITDTAQVVINQVAARLAFDGQPTTALLGVTIAPVITVTVRDALGQLLTTATDSITISLLDTAGAGGILSGTLGVLAVSGQAAFDDLSVDNAGGGYQLVATAVGLAPDTSATFDITFPPTGAFWAEPVSGSWNDPARWNTGLVPTALDTVRIIASGSYVVTVGSGVSAAAAVLEVGSSATVSIEGGTLTVDTAGLFGPTTTLALSSGTLTGPATITIDGDLLWSGGTMSGTGVTLVTSTNSATLTGTATKALNTRTFRNFGTVVWDGGWWQLTGSNPTQVVNEAGATIDAVGGRRLTWGTTNAGKSFVNDGTLLGAGDSVDVLFTHNGTVSVASGLFVIQEGGTLRGTVDVVDSAALRVQDAPVTVEATFEYPGAGRVELLNSTLTLPSGDSLAFSRFIQSGGTLEGDGTLTVARFAQSGGIFQGSGTLTVTDSLIWSAGTQSGSGTTQVSGGAVAYLTSTSTKALSTRTFRNFGTVVWDGGWWQLTGSNPTQIVNETGATIDAVGGRRITWGSTPTGKSFVNDGTLLGSNDSVDVVFTQAGTVSVEAGRFVIQEGGTLGGTVDVADTAILRIQDGPVTLDGTFTYPGTGLVELVSSTFTIPAGDSLALLRLAQLGGILQVGRPLTASEFVQSGGSVEGDGTLTVTDTMTWSAGTQRGTGTTILASSATAHFTGGSTKVLDTRTFRNFGTVVWDGGWWQLTGSNPTQIVNETGGTIDPVGGRRITWGSTNAGKSFVNNGLLLAESDSIEVSWTQQGTVTVAAGGPLVIMGGGTLGGTVDVDPASVLRFQSVPVTFASDFSFPNTGRIELVGTTLTVAAGDSIVLPRFIHTSGTLTGGGWLTVTDSLLWSAGTHAGTGTTYIPVGATAVLTSTATKFQNQRTVHNAGLIQLDNGVWRLDGSNPTTLLNLGTLELVGARTIEFGTTPTGKALVNDGVLLAADGGTIDVPFTQNGQLTVGPAVLDLLEGATLGDTVDVDPAGVLRFQSVPVAFASDFSFPNTGRIELVGTTLTVVAGDSIVLPRFAHTSGTLTGDGWLTVTDSLLWSAGTHAGTGTTYIPVGATAVLTSTATKLQNQRTFANAGLVRLENGIWRLDGSNPTAVLNSGTIEFVGARTMDLGTTPTGKLLQNDGVLLALSGGTIDVPFTQNGQLTVGPATLILDEGATLGDTVDVDPAGALRIQNVSVVFASDFRFPNTGRVELINNTITIAAGDSIVLPRFAQSGGTVAGDGALTVTDSLLWSSGTQTGPGTTYLSATATTLMTSGNTKVLSQRTFRNAGLVQLVTGIWRLEGSNPTSVVNTGTIEFLGTRTMDWGTTPTGKALVNDGTVRADSGGVIDVAFTQTGLLDVGPFALTLDGGGTLGGTVDIDPAGRVRFDGVSGTAFGFGGDVAFPNSGILELVNGTLTAAAGDSIVVPRFHHSSGTVTGDGAFTVRDSLHWTAGTHAGIGTTYIAATATAIVPSTNIRTINQRTFRNQGVFRIPDGGVVRLEGSNPTTILNEVGATWLMQGSADVDWGTTSVNKLFVNDGLLWSLAGVGNGNRFDVGLIQNGVLRADTGTTTLDRDPFTPSAGSRLEGDGTLNLLAIDPDTLFGTIDPGASPGRLTMVGDVVFDASVILLAEASGPVPVSGHDQLVVDGVLTRGGTLDVQLFYTPTVGDRLAVLVADSTVGAFGNVLLPAIEGIALDTLTVIVAGGPDTLLVLAGSSVASSMEFTVQPANAPETQTLSAIQVALKDASGNTVTSDDTTQISIEFPNLPQGPVLCQICPPVLSGTKTVTVVDGVATFNDLSVDRFVSGVTVRVVTAGLDSAVSGEFIITPTGMTDLWTAAAADGDWANPANWDDGTAPTSGDNVFVPWSAPNYPTVGALATVGDLIVEIGASLTIADAVTLTSLGVVDGGISSIAGPGVLELGGTGPLGVKGVLPSLLITGARQATGGITVNGDLTIAGAGADLEVNASVTVTGNLATQTGGTLTQTVGTVLRVDGSVTMAGGSTAGRLTAGDLSIGGDFTQTGTSNAFRASGTHRTTLDNPTLATVHFDTPGTTTDSSGFGHLSLSADSTHFTSTAWLDSSLVVSANARVGSPGVLGVLGNVTAGSGSGLSVSALTVGGSLSVSGDYDVANTIFAGATQTIPLGLPYQALTVNGTASLPGNLTIGAGLTVDPSGTLNIGTSDITVPTDVAAGGGGVTGSTGRVIMTGSAGGEVLQGTVVNLEIQDSIVLGGRTTVTDSAVVSAGYLDLNGATFDVSTGTFLTRGTGTFIMQASDSLLAGNLSFGGGSTNGLLTSGRVVSTGTSISLGVSGDSAAYYAFGNHVTELASISAPTSIAMGPGSQIHHLEVTGGANNFTTTPIRIAGDLTVSDGQFTPNTADLIDVGGNLVTTGSGYIIMAAFATIRVAGDAAFNGATGLWQSGTLNVLGNFTQTDTGSSTSFAADSSFTTILRPNAIVSFTTPGPAASHFGHVRLTRSANQGDSISLASDVYTHRVSVQDSAGGGPVIVGGPGALAVRDSLILSGVNLEGAIVRPRRVNLEGVLHFTPSSSNIFQPDTAVFLGVAGPQLMPADGAYRTVIVRGDSVVADEVSSFSMDRLVIDGGGLFALTGSFAGVTVNGDLITADSGTLHMAFPEGALTVLGNVVFGGGSTAGRLLNGTMVVGGDFTQLSGASDSSFHATLDHVVSFQSASPRGNHILTFSDATGASRFATLAFDPPAEDSITLASPVRAARVFISDFESGGAHVEVTGLFPLVSDTLHLLGVGGGTAAITTLRAVVSSHIELDDAGGSGNVALAPDTIELAGPMTLTSPPFSNVVVTDSVVLNGTSNVASLHVGGSGLVRCDSCTINTTTFATRESGRLLQSSAMEINADTVIFAGASTDSAITGGTLRVAAYFRQFSTTNTRSFAPSGGHTTVFRGDTVDYLMDDPDTSGTAGSQFARFQVDTGTVVVLGSDVAATNQLQTGAATGPVAKLLGGGNRVFVRGVNVTNGLVMDDAPIVLTDGATITALDNVTFQNMDPTTDYFALERSDIGTFTFNNIDFGTAPNSGVFYLVVNGLVPTFTLNMCTPTPATEPTLSLNVLGSAILNWDLCG